ncbi:MAG TPA: putative O-glycosylation ligase, exosortase A system-associated [Bryobacteraceae bacterium]|nr:putative O-glycosylation ligase, exosortase A system-associated [Bryobacteraceae bacterium]
MRDILITIVFVAVAIPALTRPWLGVMLWAWLDYMSPHILCYGFAARIPWVQLAAAVTLIGFVCTRESIRFPVTAETTLLLIFSLWITFTTLLALNPGETWDAWGKAIKIQVFIVAVLCAIRTPERIQSLIWVIAASIGYYGVRGGIGSVLSGGVNRVYGPDNTYIADNNDLALALVTILPMLRFLQLRAERRLVSHTLSCAMALTIFAVLCSYSRAGMLALGATALLLVMKSRRKLLLACMLGLTLTIGLSLMPPQWFDRVNSIDNYEQDASANQRLNAWTAAWNLAKDRPIVGGGFRAFTPELYEKYAPVLDYHEAHNIFLKILAEHGFPGLALFLVLGFLTWRSASWIRRNSGDDQSSLWAADLASMMQVSLLGYAVGGSFSNLAYFDLPYNLMAIVVLTKVWLQENTSDVKTEFTDSELLVGPSARQCEV